MGGLCKYCGTTRTGRQYVSRMIVKNNPLHLVNLTLFPPKTNIFVHGKNCTFSKKGLGHKGRCYSVCIDDTCKWISHTLSRIIGPSNTATKIRVPISDTGHMAQISTANPEILINFHVCSCKFMQIRAKFIRVHVKFMHFYANSCIFTQNLFVFM